MLALLVLGLKEECHHLLVSFLSLAGLVGDLGSAGWLGVVAAVVVGHGECWLAVGGSLVVLWLCLQ